MLTFTTPAASNNYDPDAERHHGPPDDREEYHSPAGSTLLVMDYEREQFEQDTHCELTSDVLTQREWQRLVRWLMRNIGLFDITRNIEIKRQERLRSEPEYFI